MLFPGEMSTGVKFHVKNSTFYSGEKFSLLDFIFYVHSSGLNSREKGGGDVGWRWWRRKSLVACFQRLLTVKLLCNFYFLLCKNCIIFVFGFAYAQILWELNFKDEIWNSFQPLSLWLIMSSYDWRQESASWKTSLLYIGMATKRRFIRHVFTLYLEGHLDQMGFTILKAEE